MSMMLPAIRGVQEDRTAQAAEKRAAEALLDGLGDAPEDFEEPEGEGTEIETRRVNDDLGAGKAQDARFRTDVGGRDGRGQADARAAEPAG